jgi:hypothetical protein
MSKPIFEIVDELPESGMTVLLLKSLDFVVPGQWQNLVGFENTIRAVTGESDEALIQAVGERAIHLYNDPSQGYQRAMWLYQTANSAGGMMGAAAMASKIGESVSFLSFLDKITPKADTTQTVDFTLKTVIEILAYCQINGIPGDGVGDFLNALGDYSRESLMRLSALICVDGLVPLGPDFLSMIDSTVSRLSIADLDSHPVFGKIADFIPGGDTLSKIGFIGQGFNAVKNWMSDFVSSRGLTPESIVGSVRQYIDVTDDKLDYFGAFLDMTTNYYEHTGVQTLARRLIERAVAEI